MRAWTKEMRSSLFLYIKCFGFCGALLLECSILKISRFDLLLSLRFSVELSFRPPLFSGWPPILSWCFSWVCCWRWAVSSCFLEEMLTNLELCGLQLCVSYFVLHLAFIPFFVRACFHFLSTSFSCISCKCRFCMARLSHFHIRCSCCRAPSFPFC